MAREEHMPGPGSGMPSHNFTEPYVTPPGFADPARQGPPGWGSPFLGRRPEPAPAPSTPSTSSPGGVSIDDQVRELARRRDAGLISYEQFASLKAEIFARS